MSRLIKSKLIAAAAVLTLVVPVSSFARDNSLRGGLSLGYDYDNRTYEPATDDPDTVVNESELDRGREDEYQSIILTPMLHFRSLSEKDSFELRTAPGIRYDLDYEEFEWDNNLYIAASRFFTRSWQLRASNYFIRSDSYDRSIGFTGEPEAPPEPTEGVTQPTDPQDPELSTDLGRTRYTSNTLNLFSDYFYMEDSLLQVGFSYILLRNDDTSFGGYEDYDRYVISLRDEHRFNPTWRSIVDLQFVRGDFDPTDPEVVDAVVGELAPDADPTPTDDQLSNDLNEYHLLLTAENDSIIHNPLSLTYNYIGAKYDAPLRNDSDIHQMRFTWRRDFSPQMYTRLGIGPSYEKTEGRDENWGGNGIVEWNYQVERGNFNFLLDKRYGVDNFSGSDERGAVDSWDGRFSFNYLLSQNLSLNGSLGFIYEDREDPVVALGRVLSTEDPQAALANEDLTGLDEYHRDIYVAGAGLSYTFMQFYTASIYYAFTKQESDRVGISDNYDDHRLLLTLSWEKDLFRW